MSLTLERLGNGAAFLLHDGDTRTTVLLGCGQLKTLGYLDASGAVASRRGGGGGEAESDEDGAVPGEESKYLAALKELVRREGDGALHALLVTDYRPETCYMLPFVTEKAGLAAITRPVPIVMTHGTRALGSHLLAEYWAGIHGKTADKTTLFTATDIHTAFQRANGIGVKATCAIHEHLKITAYHSGHVVGGCAFHIQIGTSSVLYVNDFNLGGGRVLLPAQIPRLFPTVMITRSTFAVTVSETRTVMERELMKVVQECVSAEGKVVIPVYRAGFMQEIMTILQEYWSRMNFSYPIYISDDVLESPSAFHSLLKRTYTESYAAQCRAALLPVGGDAYPRPQRFEWSKLEQPGPYVLFTTPANISQGDSGRAIRVIAGDAKNLIVLSEYCKPGTLNYMLYADPVRKDVSKALGVSISCGVHYFPCSDEVDAKSIVELARHVGAPQVFLDYAVQEDVELMKAHIEAQLKDPSGVSTVSVQEISWTGVSHIHAAREIPVRIHKSLFNNPSDVQGMLIAEPKRKLLLVSTGNGARRLKKKRHSLNFQSSWKKPIEQTNRVKKRSSRSAPSALSFLLSAPAESADEEEPDEQPVGDVDVIQKALEESLKKWLPDIHVEKKNRWLKLRSVCILTSADWEAHMEWAYEDEELAGRILGIAKQVITSEYAAKLE